MAQEVRLRLWLARATIAGLASRSVILSFVRVVTVNQAMTAARVAVGLRPLAWMGWHPDPDAAGGGRERLFDGRRWTGAVRLPDGTIETVPPSDRAHRRRPRLTRGPMDAASGPSGRVPDTTGDRAWSRILDGLARTFDGEPRVCLAPLLGSVGRGGPVRCARCGGWCRNQALAVAATWYGLVSIAESGGQLDVLLREGLELQGIGQPHARNKLLGCCVSVLDSRVAAIAGTEVLATLDSAIASCRSHGANRSVTRLIALQGAIASRGSQEQGPARLPRPQAGWTWSRSSGPGPHRGEAWGRPAPGRPENSVAAVGTGR